jgi:hypothetical protein
MEFGKHQSIDAVLLGEACDFACAMLPDTADKVASDADIERPVPLAGQNIAVVFLMAYQPQNGWVQQEHDCAHSLQRLSPLHHGVG